MQPNIGSQQYEEESKSKIIAFSLAPQRNGKMKRIRLDKEDFEMATQHSPKRDEYSIFGELVALKLRKFSHSQKRVVLAQHKIQEVLFNLEMEMCSS